jgi:tetratricopeptide (TPR) repeat protein
MRRQQTLPRWFAVLALLSAGTAPVCAQNVPLWALRDWMWYSERAQADLEKGEYARAEVKLNLAIREITPYPGANRKLMARTYCDLARVLYYQKRSAEAEPLAKWALSVRDADDKSSSDGVFQCLFTLASIHSAQKHYTDAEPLLIRALALQEKELPPGHVNILPTVEQLAMVYRELGKYKEAEPLYLRALAIHERKRPDENLDLADTAEEYAILLRRMNRAENADKWQARAVGIRDTVATKRARAELDTARKELQGFK